MIVNTWEAGCVKVMSFLSALIYRRGFLRGLSAGDIRHSFFVTESRDRGFLKVYVMFEKLQN